MIGFLVAATLASVGCNGYESNALYLTEVRKENGLVVILPGIDGETRNIHNIRHGLSSAGCLRAMPIENWGLPVPGVGLVVNQTNVIGNRLAASRIARTIEQYQDSYPGRPVFVIGHSGGGGVAVFIAEAMEDDHKLDGLLLLAPSISAGYDLSKAAANCRQGIVNFYNPDDGLLSLGTVFIGNVDGAHDVGAGLNGFRNPPGNCYQVLVSSYQSAGAHFACTTPGYVSSRVAPWVLSSSWPPHATSGGYANSTSP
jgi:pimeloyl-ACP methyl ester carboxylesterase